MTAESGLSCWQCGNQVKPVSAWGMWFDGTANMPLSYYCYECDVAYHSIVATNPRFTDPEVMREMGLIDHATAHMASPA